MKFESRITIMEPKKKKGTKDKVPDLRVAAITQLMLQIAQGKGMTKSRADAIFDELMPYYKGLPDETITWYFRAIRLAIDTVVVQE
jgi:hypothetical protein